MKLLFPLSWIQLQWYQYNNVTQWVSRKKQFGIEKRFFICPTFLLEFQLIWMPMQLSVVWKIKTRDILLKRESCLTLNDLVTESFSSCLTMVKWANIARPKGSCDLAEFSPATSAWGSGPEWWLGLDSCWCLEHIIPLLLSLGVVCGSRESGAAQGDRKGDLSQQCLQHLAVGRAAELKDGMSGSLICTNHHGDNDNE